MLTFFRRIRKRLLEGGATSKYLLYAIGEIALVVIGILIALQINNWNEWRKDRVKETILLNNLKENLVTNIGGLKAMIERNHIDDLSSDIIISAIQNEIRYSDTLDTHFAWGFNQNSEGVVLSNVGYESLKNGGFDLLRNDLLKNEVIRLFEEIYLNLQNKNDRIGQSYDDVQSLIHERLMRKPGFEYAPMDYESLLKDKPFLSRLISIKDSRLWITYTINECLSDTQRVLQLIKDELGESE